MPAKIILHRKKEWVNNRNRAIKIFFDGVEKGKIASGDSVEYIVEAGQHNIQSRIDWLTSPPLTITMEEGETKYLKLRSALKYYGIGYILVLVSLVGGAFMTFARIPKPSFFTWLQLTLLLPFVLYLLFYLTLGRNKYMVLEEDTENVFA